MRATVVIPAKDAAATLGASLASVLRQTRPVSEILVLDDGSTDGTGDLARDVGGLVRVIDGPFGGASAARRAGADAANGDALLFLDADDLLGPTALEALIRALEGTPDAVAACPWKRYELRQQCWVAAPPSCASRRRGHDHLESWLTGWYHPPCSLLWSRAAYVASGGWDPAITVNDDGDIMMRALLAGVPLVEAPGGIAYYRRPPEGTPSLSGRRTTEAGVLSELAVLDGVARRVAALGRLERTRPALAAAYLRVAENGRAYPALVQRAEEAAEDFGGPAAVRRLPRPVRRRPLPAAFGFAPAPDTVPTCSGRPLVTVVVPTYNRADLLGRALRSVLAQTYDRFEVLVVDDGSTEDIAGTVAAFADRRLKTLRQPANAGVAAARNRGIREAKGDLIAFLDSDDEWLPEKLDRQIALLARRPDRVGLVYSGLFALGSDGARTTWIPTARGDVWRGMMHHNVVHFGTSSVTVRRDVFETVGLFDETYPAIEDYDLWTRIARFYEFDFVPEPLIVYHNEATADEKRSRNFLANMAARRMFAARYGWEAREVGVLHQYYLDSARRELERPEGRTSAGLAHLARAVRHAPREPRLYAWLAFGMLPVSMRRSLGPSLKALRRRLPRQVWFGARSA